jgi:hypothetical protein
VVEFIGLVVALLVVTFADGLSSLIFGRRRHLEVPFRALPGVLVVAAAAVLLSRVFNLQPRFAFGVVASFYVAEIDDDDQGKVSMGAVLGVIVVSLVAWFVWVPARDLASGAHPSFGVLVLEASLASIFIVGIESSLIEALPLRSLHGGCIYGWNRLAWVVTFVVSAAVFIEVLLQPASGFVGPGSHPGLLLILVVGGFALFTAAFWSYFRFRPEPEDEDAEQAKAIGSPSE